MSETPDEMQVIRWRRIEAAARQIIENADRCRSDKIAVDEGPIISEIRAALNWKGDS